MLAVGDHRTTRFVSAEPLWAQVSFGEVFPRAKAGRWWLIVGGQSGSSVQRFELDWPRDLREEARAHGVAFFMKQLGARPTEHGVALRLGDAHGGDWSEWP